MKQYKKHSTKIQNTVNTSTYITKTPPPPHTHTHTHITNPTHTHTDTLQAQCKLKQPQYKAQWSLYVSQALTFNTTSNVQYVYRNTEACKRNYTCSGKATSITYSECVSVALVNQHAMCMFPITICGLSVCLSLPYFPKLSHKLHEHEQQNLLNTKRILLLFHNFCLKHFSL